MSFAVIIAVFGGIGFGGYSFYKNSQKITSPASNIQPTPKKEEALKKWTDQSEFEFQYPKSLTLNPHEEDSKNYSHVELTSATHSGNMIVWTKDTNAKDIDDFVKKNKIEGSLDTTLGGEMAIKYFDTKDTQKMFISSIRNGYLYQIEFNPVDSEFWNPILKTITDTYIFIAPTQSPQLKEESPPLSADSEALDEIEGEFAGEEVIE